MYNTNIPSDREVPSTAKLIKSTIIAVITAGVLLITVVMPSEYGIDPTGLGSTIGLKRMGEIKISLAEEAAQDALKNIKSTVVVKVEPKPQIISEINPSQSHERIVTLAPDEGTEIKLTMSKGAKVNYVWETNGGKANFDIHGDSKTLDIGYHSYSKGSKQISEGTLEAAFNGNHGWFWRNRTKEPLTITLKTNGQYTDIKRY